MRSLESDGPQSFNIIQILNTAVCIYISIRDESLTQWNGKPLVIKFRPWWRGPDKAITATSPAWNIIKAGFQIVFIIRKWISKFHHTCSQRKTPIIHHVNFAAKSTATMSKYSTVSMCFVKHVSRNFLLRTLSFAHNADGECVLENKELTDCHLMSSMIEWKTYKPVISGFSSDATHSAGRCKQLQNPLTTEDSVLLFS